MLQQARTAATPKTQTTAESSEDDKDRIRLIVDTQYMVTTHEMEEHDFLFAFIDAFVLRACCGFSSTLHVYDQDCRDVKNDKHH